MEDRGSIHQGSIRQGTGLRAGRLQWQGVVIPRSGYCRGIVGADLAS